jgi:hypothetical protein|tara:strand:+ start:2402 stop:2635 length:234 start_codon:yes stop_codon:yes gene_type:complete
MEYKYNDIEKVLEFKTWSNKRKIDELFRIDCEMYTNLGTDSTKTEREKVKAKSKAIYRTVAKIDPKCGKHLLFSMDY